MVDALKEKERSYAGKKGYQGVQERPLGGINVSVETQLGVGWIWGVGRILWWRK